MSTHADSADVVVVGGGVAGLSVAWHLCRFGVQRVVLLEADGLLSGHSSARNAAIYMPLEENDSSTRMAGRTRELLDSQLGTSWVDAVGLVYFAADPCALDELRFAARHCGVFHERWSCEQLLSRVPLLAAGPDYQALSLPLGGVMDVHRITQFMADRARRGGARLRLHAPLEQLEVQGGRVTGCILASGERIATSHVVLASGAWAGELGARSGFPLPLTPLKRHLAQLSGPELHHPRMPVAWRIDDPVYLRSESGGVLASPCDETPNVPELPQPDEPMLETLARKLQHLSARFEAGGVQRAWACLRTMAPDRECVAGADPRVTGLYWHAGLGGWGMSVGAGTGEAAAMSVLDRPHPLHAKLSPARLI